MSTSTFITKYNDFTCSDENMQTSIFTLGCIGGFALSRWSHIEKHPFWSTLDIVSYGGLYVVCYNVLTWFVPKSKKIILPILGLSVALMLYKNKLSLNAVNGRLREITQSKTTTPSIDSPDINN